MLVFEQSHRMALGTVQVPDTSLGSENDRLHLLATTWGKLLKSLVPWSVVKLTDCMFIAVLFNMIQERFQPCAHCIECLVV